jgi:hypothetical protein
MKFYTNGIPLRTVIGSPYSRTASGSFAMLTVMRLALSRVSKLAVPPIILLRAYRWPVVLHNNKLATPTYAGVLWERAL